MQDYKYVSFYIT